MWHPQADAQVDGVWIARVISSRPLLLVLVVLGAVVTTRPPPPQPPPPPSERLGHGGCGLTDMVFPSDLPAPPPPPPSQSGR